jgi:ATP synthase protein I
MSKEDRPPSLEQLDARLKAAQARRGGRAGRGSKADGRTDRGEGIGFAFRIGTELVAGLGVGAGIGWLLDDWLGTRPWLMIVFFILGAAAGMLNVYRALSGIGYGAGYRNDQDRKPGKPGTPDETSDRGDQG